jgi:hypothetical protein
VGADCGGEGPDAVEVVEAELEYVESGVGSNELAEDACSGAFQRAYCQDYVGWLGRVAKLAYD